MLTLELAGNTTRMNFASRMVDILLSRQSLQKQFISGLTMMKRKRLLRNMLLRQVKSYLDNNLNLAKGNVIDLTKDNFPQPLGITEFLDGLEISKDDYYRVLSISKDEDLELHLKRQPNSCFVNNYFDVGLKA